MVSAPSGLHRNCGEWDVHGHRCLLTVGHLQDHLGSSRQMDYFQAPPEPLPPRLYFRRLDTRARAPRRAYAGDAGWDLYALTAGRVAPYEFADVHTGVAIAVPYGYWARVTGRSSTVRNHNLLVVEAIIDEGWRGELFFGVRNLGARSVPIQAGDRLAQVILHERIDVNWIECDDLPPGERGERGFGSSGR